MSCKSAFVLMPFREPYASYYSEIYEPALKIAGYDAVRADLFTAPRPVILDIFDSILKADIVLCEMSGRNANVFYELGLAHAIGKPCILLSDEEEDIPFDLRHIRTIIYDRGKPTWDEDLRGRIIDSARALEPGMDTWPPPLLPQQTDLEDAFMAALRRAVTNESWREVERLGVVLSRPLWVTGKWHLRVQLGSYLERAGLHTDNAALRASSLIDDIGWTSYALSGNSWPNHVETISVDRERHVINRGITIADRSQIRYLCYRGHRHLSHIAADLQQFDLAETELNRSRQYIEGIPNGQRAEAEIGSIFNCAFLQLKQSQWRTAIDSLLTAERRYRKLQDEDRAVKLLPYFGEAYLGLQEEDMARESFAKGLAHGIAEARNDVILHCYTGLAEVEEAELRDHAARSPAGPARIGLQNAMSFFRHAASCARELGISRLADALASRANECQRRIT